MKKITFESSFIYNNEDYNLNAIGYIHPSEPDVGLMNPFMDDISDIRITDLNGKVILNETMDTFVFDNMLKFEDDAMEALRDEEEYAREKRNENRYEN